jgi:hypothetical protein
LSATVFVAADSDFQEVSLRLDREPVYEAGARSWGLLAERLPAMRCRKSRAIPTARPTLADSTTAID